MLSLVLLSLQVLLEFCSFVLVGLHIGFLLGCLRLSTVEVSRETFALFTHRVQLLLTCSQGKQVLIVFLF